MLITLKDGFVVEVAALRRLWDLEERGVHFSLLDDGRVRVAPADRLTADDRAFLHAHHNLVIYSLTTTLPDDAGVAGASPSSQAVA